MLAPVSHCAAFQESGSSLNTESSKLMVNRKFLVLDLPRPVSHSTRTKPQSVPKLAFRRP